MSRIQPWLSCLALAAACGGDEPSVDPDAPMIASLTSSVSTLYENGMVTFSATVTDRQGPADIVSGSLTNGASVSYGMFTQTAPGTYGLLVDWARIHAVEAINGDVNGESRDLTATFVDLAGHAGSATLTLILACQTTGPKAAPCDGVCKAVETDRFNCGGCGLACPGESSFTYCRASLCQEVHLMFTERISCDAACGARGGKCDHDNVGCPGAACDLEEQSFARYTGGISVPLASCAAVPPAMSNGGTFQELGCNCKDLPASL